MKDISRGFLSSGPWKTRDHPAEDVTREDDDGKRATAFEVTPVTSSAENPKYGRPKMKLPIFKKIPKATIETVDTASPTDHPEDDVTTPKDDDGKGAAPLGQPPVTPSAENPKQGKQKINFPKFRKGTKTPKAASNTVASPPPKELSFKENIEAGFLENAGQQLIAREEALFRPGPGREGAQAEGREKEEDGIQEDYETLLVRVWLAVQKSLRATPEELEALRAAVGVILQEEKQDRRWQEEAGAEAPEWRPRKCRLAHDAFLTKMVERRMENTEDAPVAEKLSSSLKKDVCKMGKRVQTDLLKVVQVVKGCYPAEFDVCNTYARLYHQAFSSRLVKMTELNLDQDDLVYLLCWVHNYYPSDVLKHKELEKDIDSEALGRLLPEAVIKPLEDKYLSQKESQVAAWMSSALKKEEDSWYSSSLPELVSDSYYFSLISIDVIQLADATVKETKTIFGDLSRAPRILSQFQAFLMRYKKSLEEFVKTKHVNTKPVLKANLASIEQLKEYLEKSADLVPEERNKTGLTLLEDMKNCAFGYFLDLIRTNLTVQYKLLWTLSWLDGGGKQLVESLESQIWDCRDMKPTCRQELASRLHVQVVVEYVRRMMKMKMKLKDKRQQEVAASLLHEDNKMISLVFAEAGSKETWLQDILPKIAEVIKLQDPESIQLEVITLAQKYPDLSDKHIAALLRLKNLTSGDIKRIKESLAANRPSGAPGNTLAFFSRVQLPKLLPKML